MECALRINVFINSLLKLKCLTQGERETILQTIYLHAWLIHRRMSLFSSLGNHTITECMGLILAGLIFRKNENGQKWLKTGIKILEQEAFHQILNDGGPAEQSLGYHRFIIDIYWYCLKLLTLNTSYDIRKIFSRVKEAEIFLHHFALQNNDLPNIGDNDNGKVIAPGIYPIRILKNKNKKSTRKHIKTFDASGYTIIKNKELFLIFDHGPLGMPPLYNHGHADALSIIVYYQNRPFFTDPGTYRYNNSKIEREYFKGTKAHNTVTIDNLDQAEQVTSFIWANPYKTNWVKNESEHKFYIEAYHDGYTRLKDDVLHFRKLILAKQKIYIFDTFKGNGEHTFELNFHLDPKVQINFEEEKLITLQNETVTLKVESKNFAFNTFSGQKKPFFGWHSNSYGHIQKTNVLSCTKTGHPDQVKFLTIIHH